MAIEEFGKAKENWFTELLDLKHGIPYKFMPRRVSDITDDNKQCRCRNCESAVSPLAYLANLLKYGYEEVTISTFPPGHAVAKLPELPVIEPDLIGPDGFVNLSAVR